MPNFALGILEIERLNDRKRPHRANGTPRTVGADSTEGSLLIQFLVEQNKGLQEQLDKVTQLLISQQGQTVPKPMEDSSLHQDQWLDNQDLSQLLHVSVRSLQRYRSLGILPYKMMHKKAYYTKEGVLQFLNSNVVNYDREEVALYFAKLGMSA